MSGTIPDSAIVVAAGDLLTSEFDRELVILNLRDSVYYGLEDVGARIWNLLQKPVPVSAIRDLLVSEYDVDPARCDRDLQGLLAELVTRGLVQIRERG
ncbi:MAG: PqqD family protein [Gemmatimonadetes bacterium]|nr:PqqD family protein [Gemmatimonadota bacterium]